MLVYPSLGVGMIAGCQGHQPHYHGRDPQEHAVGSAIGSAVESAVEFAVASAGGSAVYQLMNPWKNSRSRQASTVDGLEKGEYRFGKLSTSSSPPYPPLSPSLSPSLSLFYPPPSSTTMEGWLGALFIST